MSGVEVWGDGCECWVTPEKYWLSAASCGYGSGYEPGSQIEYNPDCPMHGEPTEARSEATAGDLRASGVGFAPGAVRDDESASVALDGDGDE